MIKADANQPLPYVLRATALMYSKDLDQASKHLREALRLDPDLQEAQQGMKKVRKLERHMDAGKQATHSRRAHLCRSASYFLFCPFFFILVPFFTSLPFFRSSFLFFCAFFFVFVAGWLLKLQGTNDISCFSLKKQWKS